MTDPVDTDALRRLAGDVEQGWDTETGPSLRDAADEIDRLRDERSELVHVSFVDSKRDELRAVEAGLRTWIVDFRTILFQHQRKDSSSCVCGFETKLQAHSDHQADMLQQRLAEISES